MMGGMLLTSIASGQLISRTGRYKLFPIVGTLVMAFGLWLLSRMTEQTSTASAALTMLVLGLGLGMVMQVLVIAVQNAVEYRDLGVATSGATLFRLVGGSLGTAVLGAIFAARLASILTRLLPGSARATGAGALNPETMSQLSPALRAIYVRAFTESLSTVFVVATGIALLGFLLTWLMPERPLRATVAAVSGSEGVGEVGAAFAMPTDRASEAYVLRGLAALADRDVQGEHARRICERAGVDLSPLAAWLLVRIDEHPGVPLATLGRTRATTSEMTGALTELRAKGLVIERSHDGGGPGWELTRAGCEALGKLVTARREHLSELFAEWDPAKRAELAAVMRRLAEDLVPKVQTEPRV
jgi:DNA-binding MarR family transcriptional regulator